MLRSLKSLKDSVIHAADGEIGSVKDFLFDDDKWTVRYLVVHTGSWLAGKKVLISPIATQGFDHTDRAIHVALTRDQVKRSPDIDTDKPVSRQQEMKYFDYYEWPYYWGGNGIWGISGNPYLMAERLYPVTSKPASHVTQEKGDPHLRSAETLHGYGIDATDQEFGSLDDFVMDTESWSIRYLVVDTNKFLSLKKVILSPDWVDSISWPKRKIRVNLTKETIKNSPEYIADASVNREYEERLYDYYGRPTYWEQNPPEDLEKFIRRAGNFRM
jgi:sporulation protein YlmC with PRC-barrel domain